MTMRQRASKQNVILAALVMSILSSFPRAASRSPTAEAMERNSPARRVSTDDSVKRRAMDALGALALRFEEIRDSANNGVAFIARAAGIEFGIKPTEAVMRLHKQKPRSSHSSPAMSLTGRVANSPAALDSDPDGKTAPVSSVSMRLIGANRRARVIGDNQLATRTSYFIGKDASRWQTGVRNYERVRVEHAYRGIDVVYYGSGRQLEYDFIVAPGASYKVIRIGFEGGDRVSVDDAGDLLIEIGGEKVYQRKPVAYQMVNGIKKQIAARYVLSSGGDAGFAIGAYDSKLPLIIDPVLSYSTYLGGAPISSVAVDRNGNAYVTGTFQLGSFGRVSDAFVMKLNREGTAVLYSTFLGGSDRRIAEVIENRTFGIAVDSNGNAYVTGSTVSKDFSTTPGAFQTTLPGTRAGRRSAFVTKLNPTGDALVYSTYLGGTDDFSQSTGQAIAVDEAGSAYVAGFTDAFKFPLVNPIQSINRGGTCFGGDVAFPCVNEAFVSKLNASGSALIYSTYLGGRGNDSGSGIAVDSAGSAYVVGTTSASGFPTKNALQLAGGGSSDLFIAKLSVAGNELIYSTLLGGSGGDAANGVAVDSSGNAYVTGRTVSTDFPTTPGSLQAANTSSTAFKSTDGGTTWSAINHGFSGTDVSVNQLVFDPINSSTLYANTGGGVFKSTDGGNNWRVLKVGSIAGPFITALAIDPVNPATLYAGVFFGPCCGHLEKSTDGGNTWFFTDAGLTPNVAFSILIDPQNPNTLYTAVQVLQDGGQSAGIIKSTDGGTTWVPSARGVSRQPVFALALAPTKPKRLYSFSGSSIFRTNNGGKKWKQGGGNFGNLFNGGLIVDPLNPNTVYLGTRVGVFKSTDGAETWSSTPLHASIGLIAVDPKNPTTIYAAGSDSTDADGNFKSTDGGESWKALGRISANFVATFAIDPNNASIVYAGSYAAQPGVPSGDAFVAKINPTGTALVYSTYLGGTGDDIARAIKVDAQGNAYLTGQSSSEDFPIKGALQQHKLGATRSYDAFLTKLDPSGDLIYSTYLGGSGDDDGRALALDAAGGLYIAGSTDSDDFPTMNPIQGARSGPSANGFVTKIVGAGGNEVGFSQAKRSR